MYGNAHAPAWESEKIWIKMSKKGGERNERNQTDLFTFS